MKYIAAVLLITLWFLATIGLILTVLGISIVMDDDWAEVPKTAMRVFEQNNSNEKNTKK